MLKNKKLFISLIHPDNTGNLGIFKIFYFITFADDRKKLKLYEG